MGTWIKETDQAIYLMQGGYWISKISKHSSKTNPKEKVLNITGLQAWFTREDYPQAMTVSVGTGAPEPEKIPAFPASPPTPAGKINASGLEIVKHFEGVRLKAYQDSVGVWTIGYGHTSMAGEPQVYAGMTITSAQAEAILKKDLGLFERGASDAVKGRATPDQFSAMVSFSFNVGLGSLNSSTLLRKHKAGDIRGAANEFLRWVYAGDQQLPGLVRRRNAERALYLSQDYRAYM